MTCPKCGSLNVVKNGFIRNGKQKHQCNDCYCQFVENPQSNKISPKLINLIDNLLLEKLPLAGIRRVTGVSKSWLQNYVNQKYEEISKKV
ncbi:hypothetical protein TI05_17400, partial [Achromatium sp. WMS3]